MKSNVSLKVKILTYKPLFQNEDQEKQWNHPRLERITKGLVNNQGNHASKRILPFHTAPENSNIPHFSPYSLQHNTCIIYMLVYIHIPYTIYHQYEVF